MFYLLFKSHPLGQGWDGVAGRDTQGWSADRHRRGGNTALESVTCKCASSSNTFLLLLFFLLENLELYIRKVWNYENNSDFPFKTKYSVWIRLTIEIKQNNPKTSNILHHQSKVFCFRRGDKLPLSNLCPFTSKSRRQDSENPGSLAQRQMSCPLK